MNLLWLTLQDLKQPKILVRLFIPFIAGIILVSLMGYGLFGFFLTSDMVTQNPIVQDIQNWEAQAEQSLQAIPLIGGLLLWIIGAVVAVVAGILGVIIGSYLVLLFAMIITGFMTDSLVKAVHDLHYPNVAYEGHGSMWGMIWDVVIFGLKMLLLILLTLPMLLIPLINVLWFWMIGFLFFRYSVVADVGQVILPKQVFENIKPVTNWSLTTPLMILYALSIVPILSFFVPVLAVIAAAHYSFQVLQDSDVVPLPRN
jgi:hypothetical protein